jgi:flagellar biosynthesis protein FlhB
VAENDSGGEKTEEPTPKKLQDARNEGQVAMSMELNTAVLLLVGLCLLASFGTWFCQAAAVTIRFSLMEALTWEMDDTTTVRAMVMNLAPLGLWAAAFIGSMAATGLVVCIAQVGFNLSGQALIPKFERISPLTGFGRLFGLRGLMRFLTNVLKLIILTGIAWMALASDIPRLAYITGDLGTRLANETWWIFLIGLKLALTLGIVGATDLLYQRFQHHRDLMMTKQEVKEEFKQSEGDPLVKSKIRQIQRAMAQRRMMQEVPKADVVITNPTHVAVALKYDAQKMAAPIVLAKGYDEVAQKIKKLAAEHNIPMVENVPLARALAKEIAVGKPVPGKLYQAVAEVLSYVYKLKRGR